MFDHIEKFFHHYSSTIAFLAAFGNICTSLMLYFTLVVNGQFTRFKGSAVIKPGNATDILRTDNTPTLVLEVVNDGATTVYFSDRCLELSVPLSPNHFLVPFFLPQINGPLPQQFKIMPGSFLTFHILPQSLETAREFFANSYNQGFLSDLFSHYAVLHLRSVAGKKVRVHSSFKWLSETV